MSVVVETRNFNRLKVARCCGLIFDAFWNPRLNFVRWGFTPMYLAMTHREKLYTINPFWKKGAVTVTKWGTTRTFGFEHGAHLEIEGQWTLNTLDEALQLIASFVFSPKGQEAQTS